MKEYTIGQRVEFWSSYPDGDQWRTGRYLGSNGSLHMIERDDKYLAGRTPTWDCLDEDVRPLLAAPELPIFMCDDAASRKEMPVATGFLKYFPNAIKCVAYLSKVGNDQHNPGQPLHWAKEKSADEPDACARHFLDDLSDAPQDPRLARLGPLGHKTQKAWRAMADLERAAEALMKELGR